MALVALDGPTIPAAKVAIAPREAYVRSAMGRAARARSTVQLFEYSATVAPLLQPSRVTARSIRVQALLKAQATYLPVPHAIDLLSEGRAYAPYANPSEA